MTLTIPGEPVGKGRPRLTRTGKAYTPARTRAYEQKIRQAYLEQNGEKLNGYIVATITAYMQIPKSASKRQAAEMAAGIIRPAKTPDIDNIVKAALDGLNGLAYEDDKQIVKVVAEKWYSIKPRLEIELSAAGNRTEQYLMYILRTIRRI